MNICIAYIIWFECCMVCAFMLFEMTCKCVLDVDDTCWRLWGTPVIVWERGVVCPMVPSSSCVVCGVFKNMSNEGSSLNKVHLNRCLVDITWVNLSNKKTSNSIHISRDLGLCWSRSPFEPWLKSVLKDEDGSSNTFSVWPSQTWHGVVPVFLLLFMACQSELSPFD